MNKYTIRKRNGFSTRDCISINNVYFMRFVIICFLSSFMVKTLRYGDNYVIFAIFIY